MCSSDLFPSHDRPHIKKLEEDTSLKWKENPNEIASKALRFFLERARKEKYSWFDSGFDNYNSNGLIIDFIIWHLNHPVSYIRGKTLNILEEILQGYLLNHNINCGLNEDIENKSENTIKEKNNSFAFLFSKLFWSK